MRGILAAFVFCFTALFSSVPEPTDLQTGWWRNLNADKQSVENIEQLQGQLEALRSDLQQERSSQAIANIDRVLFQIKEYQEQKNAKVSYKKVHPLYLQKYYVADWLNVLEKEASLKLQKQKYQSEKDQIQLRASFLRSELDQLQVRYGTLPQKSLDKLLLGLKVMATRFQIESLELKMEQLQSLITDVSNNLEVIDEELDVAFEKLDFSNLKEKEIQSSIQALEKESEALASTGTSEIAMLTAQVNQEVIDTQILFERVKWLLANAIKDHHTEQFEGELQKVQTSLSQMLESVNSLAKIVNNYIQNPEGKNNDQLAKANDLRMQISSIQLKLYASKTLITKVQEKKIEQTSAIEHYFLLFWWQVGSLADQVTDVFSVKLFRINDYPVSLWVLLRAILILGGSIGVGLFVQGYINNNEKLKIKITSANAYILSRIIFYGFVALGIFLGCVSLGINSTNFVIVAGALGVGVGLGMQSIVNNFFSGLILLFSKTIKVGDLLETQEGIFGRVKAINMHNVNIRTTDGKDVLVPNSDLVSKRLLNWTLGDPYVRLNIPFDVAYGSDKEHVEEVALNVAKNLSFVVLDESICSLPKVWLRGMGDSALNLELIIWVNIRKTASRGNMKAEALWELEKGLRNAGISIPFPQREVRLLGESQIALKEASK